MKQPVFAMKVCSKIRWLMAGFFVFVLLLAGCGTISSTNAYLAEDRDSRWVNDITYLEKTLPRVHKNLYFKITEEEFTRQLEELKNKVHDYTDEEIEIALSVILAGIGDTHTGLNMGVESMYPLELHWFAEGIYITGTSKEHQELLNTRIIKVNGIKMEEAANKLRPLLQGANESWFKNQVIYYLTIPGVLKYFGLSESDEIGLEIELTDGQKKQVQLKPINYEEYVPIEQSDKVIPLYRSHPDENYWYEYLKDEKMIYLNYTRCREMENKPFKTFAKEFWDFAKSHEADKLIIDIRENGGGSSTILDSFIKELKKSKFNENGKLFVIIGKDTFSSAILNAISLKKDTMAWFVGEATGGEPNHYGEVKKFELPNSKIPIRYSTKYFHWLDQDVNTIEPDVVIEETFASYREGTAPVLEWIKKQN
ncbi:peptidase S41 [Defluviitalea raffinosedens]|uniref:Peptidase S41 n=1 Tax=Defluviitalea raffinosedens TaxID=1450156 RepID=A0A7C8HDS8_9FIRM|nr:S41 family peptidase [Defluviitalea raffinosedens]KAE9630661.1 peptidase S41 [Defluviitalea raffinosedens]